MIDYMASAGANWRAATRICISPATGRKFRKGRVYVRFPGPATVQAREASILHRLAKGRKPTFRPWCGAIYIGNRSAADGRRRLFPYLAHLEDLVARGIVATDGDPVIGGDRNRMGGPA